MIDVIAQRLRSEQNARVDGFGKVADPSRHFAPDVIAGIDAPEECRRGPISPMRRFLQIKPMDLVGLYAGCAGEGGVLVAAERHVINLGCQTFVGLTGQREAGRVRNGAGKNGRQDDAPAARFEGGQRSSAGEGHVVQVGRDEKRGAGGGHGRCGLIFEWNFVERGMDSFRLYPLTLTLSPKGARGLSPVRRFLANC